MLKHVRSVLLDALEHVFLCCSSYVNLNRRFRLLMLTF